MDKVKGYLDLPEVRKLLPSTLRYVNFAWGKPNPNADIVDLYVIKSNRDGVAPLSGGYRDAVQTAAKSVSLLFPCKWTEKEPVFGKT